MKRVFNIQHISEVLRPMIFKTNRSVSTVIILCEYEMERAINKVVIGLTILYLYHMYSFKHVTFLSKDDQIYTTFNKLF